MTGPIRKELAPSSLKESTSDSTLASNDDLDPSRHMTSIDIVLTSMLMLFAGWDQFYMIWFEEDHITSDTSYYLRSSLIEMERKKIILGIASHLPRYQWQSDHQHLETSFKCFEENLKLFSSTVNSAFQNGIAYLKSIHNRDFFKCEKIYRSVLKNDRNNLNALLGMYEVTVSATLKEDCYKQVQRIMTTDEHREALPNALLEIGLILSLLIPEYKNVEGQTNIHESPQQVFESDFDNLDFQIEEIPMETGLLTDYQITHLKRACTSVHYFQEGLRRFAELKSDDHRTDLLVWKFFVAQAYNRLDHFISETRGSRMDRQAFGYKSLELFCEIVTGLDPARGIHEKLYVQRSLAYIRQILTSRKDLLKQGKPDSFVPECFQQIAGHFLRGIWDKPVDAFVRALNYGFDTVAYTRYAKVLLHENKFDDCIRYISEVFQKHDGVHWYAASIRLTAYKLKYQQYFNDAKESEDFSSLPRDLLTKAAKDGEYCFDSHFSASSLSDYATILKWLGTSPDGSQITDRHKIYEALQVLNRVYIEEGCHTFSRVHKVRAECHFAVDELDKAITYMLWSLNCTNDFYSKPPVSFFMLIKYLLKKLQHDDRVVDFPEKTDTIRQIKYFMEDEIQHCHEMIADGKKCLDDRLFRTLRQLLNKYDRKYICEAEGLAANKPEQKKFVNTLKEKYTSIFAFLRWCCNSYPDEIKRLLELALEQQFRSTTSTITEMCLKCLGQHHREWTQIFNKKLKTLAGKEELEDMFSTVGSPKTVTQYDYLVIHAPEDKDWVFFKFLPEMEDRPKRFEGCVPDRDFERDKTFEQNIDAFMMKTTKILLIITPKFFERVYELLQKTDILDKLKEMYTSKTVDVIAVFAASFPLDEVKHRKLFRFKNVNVSGSFFDWNYLRLLLVKQLPQKDTQRAPVIWEDATGEGQIRPKENAEETYRELKENVLPYGVPEATYICKRSAYIVGYDGEKKIPRWVAHKIDKNIPLGTVSRKTDKKQLHKLHSDQSIPPQARSAVKDYALDDITKGHMAPLADHSTDVKSARETNFMTNIYPEIKNNFLWNRLEEYCRDELTKDFETIYIISGTLFRPQEECESVNIEAVSGPKSHIEECTDDVTGLQTNGSSNQRHPRESPKKSRGVKTVTYKVVGSNEVAVPTHLFKVIIGKNPGAEPCVGAFMVPNDPLYDADLDNLSVSISKLEQWLGINLCRKLDTELKRNPTSSLPPTFFSKHYRIRKMLRYVTSLEDLNRVWRNMPKDLRADHDLFSVHEEKKSHLEKKPIKQQK